MPRGFKRDNTSTIARQYLDSRSFVSRPKVIPDCPNAEHEILYGKDKGAQREVIFHRANGHCERCHRKLVLHDEEGLRMEWHHKAKKPADRCDCVEAGEARCRFCHDIAHEGRKPRWTKKS